MPLSRQSVGLLSGNEQIAPKNAYILDLPGSEWADYATVEAECRTLSGNELTHYLSGNAGSQSS